MRPQVGRGRPYAERNFVAMKGSEWPVIETVLGLEDTLIWGSK